MKRLAIILIVLIVIGCGLYFLDQYWIHRYDAVIAREAARHQVDPDLVWSIAYEETYFRAWKTGRNGEIGLMQVTPVVAREWAAENSVALMGSRTAFDASAILADPERNIQIACWYLQKAGADYPNIPGREARMLAAYNAGPSRAADWNRVESGARPLNEQEFIARIDIPSTRAYVTSILDRYRRVKSAKANALVSFRLDRQNRFGSVVSLGHGVRVPTLVGSLHPRNSPTKVGTLTPLIKVSCYFFASMAAAFDHW